MSTILDAGARSGRRPPTREERDILLRNLAKIYIKLKSNTPNNGRDDDDSLPSNNFWSSRESVAGSDAIWCIFCGRGFCWRDSAVAGRQRKQQLWQNDVAVDMVRFWSFSGFGL